eukprot:SAG22_NODE_319_length_12493_cov_33.326475_5_plen_172_part_00
MVSRQLLVPAPGCKNQARTEPRSTLTQREADPAAPHPAARDGDGGCPRGRPAPRCRGPGRRAEPDPHRDDAARVPPAARGAGLRADRQERVGRAVLRRHRQRLRRSTFEMNINEYQCVSICVHMSVLISMNINAYRYAYTCLYTCHHITLGDVQHIPCGAYSCTGAECTPL